MTSDVEKKIDRYTPAAIEEKWRERWASSGLHNTADISDKPNFYFLTMFPYPSGEIHVGHWYAFAPPDAAARFLRMRGHNVLFPMGFDAFGINAENAAIDRKLHPAVWTEKNMAHMREQFNRMGAAIDWRREVVTCYPEYYRWNQWMFLKLYEKGLAYRADAPANWCHRAEVERYVQHARNMGEIERASAEREKTGVDTGAFARNVFTGERIPIWVADYVLATYGTGAIMAVPGHDERDFAFAKKHRLEIREVISPDGAEHSALEAPYVGEGVMVRSGPFTGMRSEMGKAAVGAEVKKRGIGGPSVTYRLHDWLISRQRYWGTPIPIVHCERCGAVPVPYEQLPVVLPRDVEFTGRGGSPLSHVASFVNATCPKCGEIG